MPASSASAGATASANISRGCRRRRSDPRRCSATSCPTRSCVRLNAGETIIADRFDERLDPVRRHRRLHPGRGADVAARTWSTSSNRIFSAFDALALRLGVEKIKTIGDAYMAAAGLPEPRADHAEAHGRVRARHARGRSTRINARRRRTPFQIRIGMHAGPVVAGIIGRHKFIYDVWGDTVNVASRLESQGLPGRIQVSEAMRRALAHRYEFELQGRIALKGRGEASDLPSHRAAPAVLSGTVIPFFQPLARPRMRSGCCKRFLPRYSHKLRSDVACNLTGLEMTQGKEIQGHLMSLTRRHFMAGSLGAAAASVPALAQAAQQIPGAAAYFAGPARIAASPIGCTNFAQDRPGRCAASWCSITARSRSGRWSSIRTTISSTSSSRTTRRCATASALGGKGSAGTARRRSTARRNGRAGCRRRRCASASPSFRSPWMAGRTIRSGRAPCISIAAERSRLSPARHAGAMEHRPQRLVGLRPHVPRGRHRPLSALPARHAGARPQASRRADHRRGGARRGAGLTFPWSDARVGELPAPRAEVARAGLDGRIARSAACDGGGPTAWRWRPSSRRTNAPGRPGRQQRAPGTDEDFVVNVGRRTFFPRARRSSTTRRRVTLDKQAAWLARYPTLEGQGAGLRR